ncbi:MAG: hypothetical protein ACRD2X_28245 [Vicinamibacteraceae bacterium]
MIHETTTTDAMPLVGAAAIPARTSKRLAAGVGRQEHQERRIGTTTGGDLTPDRASAMTRTRGRSAAGLGTAGRPPTTPLAATETMRDGQSEIAMLRNAIGAYEMPSAAMFDCRVDPNASASVIATVNIPYAVRKRGRSRRSVPSESSPVVTSATTTAGRPIHVQATFATCASKD